MLSALFDRQNYRGDRWGLIALVLAVSIFCSPLFRHPLNSTGEVDWNQLASVHLILKRTLIHYGQIPLWTPFFGGGYPLWAYPENDFLNPFFLALIPFNLWFSLKVRVWLYYIIGAIGMYALGRRCFRFSLAGAFFSASLFVFQTYLPYQVATGNLYIGNFYYLPWLLYLLIKTPTGKKYRVALSLLLAHLLTGATGLWVPCLLLFLFIWALLEAIRRRPRFGYLKNLVLAVGLAVLLAAIRLVPMVELLRHSERAFTDYSEAARGSLTPSGLLRSLLCPGPFHLTEGGGLSRDEPLADSTIYLGPFTLLVVAVVLIFSWKKYARLLFILVIFSLLTMGAGSPIDLFRLLWHLPVFRSFHFPNKYFSPFIAFILSLIAGEFFLLPRFQARSRRLAAAFLTLELGILGHLFLAGIQYHRHLFDRSLLPLEPSREFFQVLAFWEPSPLPENLAERESPFYRPGNLTHPYGSLRRVRMDRDRGPRDRVVLLRRYEAEQYALAEKNIGNIYWYGGLYLKEMASPRYFIELGRVDLNESPPLCYPRKQSYFLNPAYRGEAYLELARRPAGVESFSPASILLSVNTPQADTLVINQNYYPGWKSTVGKVFAYRGLLAVPIDRPGSCPVRFSFLPATFFLGLIVSVLTVLGIFIWAVRGK